MNAGPSIITNVPFCCRALIVGEAVYGRASPIWELLIFFSVFCWEAKIALTLKQRGVVELNNKIITLENIFLFCMKSIFIYYTFLQIIIDISKHCFINLPVTIFI